MYFINVNTTDSNEGSAFANLVGLKMELQPITGDTGIDAALYTELWHRIRRHRLFLSVKNEKPLLFDASFYTAVPEDSKKDKFYLKGVLLENCAKTELLQQSSAESSRKIAISVLEQIDNLISGFTKEDIEELKTAKRSGIKSFLKAYCRQNGIIVSMKDYNELKSKEKAEREKAYHERAALRSRKNA